MRIDRRGHDHRPYPAPRTPWAMAMVWHDLLFMHWPIPKEALRPHVPAGLEIDTFTGGAFVDQAFIGVVPFRMSGVRPRGVPSIPGFSAFPELNVRTYVRAAAPRGRAAAEPQGRAGVWFFSLDAANRLAVVAARASFHLAYYHAKMTCERQGAGPGPGGDSSSWVHYESTRTDRAGAPAAFKGKYRAVGPAGLAAPGSLDSFLTDRYCLYAADRRGRIERGEIHHDPWPLRPAEAQVSLNTMTEHLGIDLGGIDPEHSHKTEGWPLLHFVGRLEVAAWLPVRVR